MLNLLCIMNPVFFNSKYITTFFSILFLFEIIKMRCNSSLFSHLGWNASTQIGRRKTKSWLLSCLLFPCWLCFHAAESLKLPSLFMLIGLQLELKQGVWFLSLRTLTLATSSQSERMQAEMQRRKMTVALPKY